jgi:hypothetical protein
MIISPDRCDHLMSQSEGKFNYVRGAAAGQYLDSFLDLQGVSSGES